MLKSIKQSPVYEICSTERNNTARVLTPNHASSDTFEYNLTPRLNLLTGIQLTATGVIFNQVSDGIIKSHKARMIYHNKSVPIYVINVVPT